MAVSRALRGPGLASVRACAVSHSLTSLPGGYLQGGAMASTGSRITHTHQCPRCGTSWECGEANYQDECAYPTRTFCTNGWAQEVPRDAPLPEKRNEHTLGAGRSCPRELGRWHTSSLNLASEPRTPPV